MRRSLLGLTIIPLLAACAAQPGPTVAGAASAGATAAGASQNAPIRSLVYRCGEGELVAARFQGSNVTLGLPDGRSMTLAAAGRAYSDGTVTFAESGNQASVETPTRRWTGCRPLR